MEVADCKINFKDDTMNKRPSLQFYPADWLKDPDLQMCSMDTIGIWINLLCRMWEAKEEGILRGTATELSLLVGARPREFKNFLKEAEAHKFCNVSHDVTKGHKDVTIVCRRMNKAFKVREGDKLRKQRQRGKDVPLIVTPPSSASSSSSINKETKAKKFTPPTVAEIDEYCREKGVKVLPQYIWDFYDGKDWKVGKNKMTKWRSAVSRAQYWEGAPRRKLPKQADPKAEAAALERKREEIRQMVVGGRLKSMNTKELKEILAKPDGYRNRQYLSVFWLIKEILAERNQG